MNFINRAFFYLFFFPVIIIAGCGTDASVTTGWQRAGLDGMEVETIQAADGQLFAGTNEGVFTSKFSFNKKWTPIGLDIDTARVVDFIIWNRNELMAAVEHENFRAFGRVVPMVFKTNNGGKSWMEYTNHLIEDVPNSQITGLEWNPKNNDELYIHKAFLLKSSDRGNSWEMINTDLLGGYFFTVSKFHPTHMWNGGVGTIGSPRLYKSTDGGISWEWLGDNIDIGKAVSYDAIVRAADPAHVLVGMGGGVGPVNVVRKSTDGGQSWQTVHEIIVARTLAHSAMAPDRVYASGRNDDGTVFFAKSEDFGDSWDRFQFEQSPTLTTVNDIVSVIQEGREVLYLATDKGLFRYVF